MELSNEEVQALYDYFMRAGYVSREFDPLIHPLIKKLEHHLENVVLIHRKEE